MAETFTVWWVRHGPTHQKVLTGWRDVPADLSDAQVTERLSAYLPAGVPVISSDLLRAVQTAEAIAGNGLRLPASPGLREIHLGDWEGRPFDEVAAEHPELSRAFWEHPGTATPPGGECWNDLVGRVNAAVAALVPHRAVIAVAHIGVILTQVQRALRVSPAEALGYRIDPLSVTRLVCEGGWRAEVINHCP